MTASASNALEIKAECKLEVAVGVARVEVRPAKDLLEIAFRVKVLDFIKNTAVPNTIGRLKYTFDLPETPDPHNLLVGILVESLQKPKRWTRIPEHITVQKEIDQMIGDVQEEVYRLQKELGLSDTLANYDSTSGLESHLLLLERRANEDR